MALPIISLATRFDVIEWLSSVRYQQIDVLFSVLNIVLYHLVYTKAKKKSVSLCLASLLLYSAYAHQ